MALKQLYQIRAHLLSVLLFLFIYEGEGLPAVFLRLVLLLEALTLNPNPGKQINTDCTVTLCLNTWALFEVVLPHSF